MAAQTAMTTFGALRRVIGMSQPEVAAWLAVRTDTVKSWESGRRVAPVEALDRMATLADHIHRSAENAVLKIMQMAAAHGAGAVEIGLARSDAEAQSLGFPTISAHAMALALTLHRARGYGHTVEIVQRGSTHASKAAVQAHIRRVV